MNPLCFETVKRAADEVSSEAKKPRAEVNQAGSFWRRVSV